MAEFDDDTVTTKESRARTWLPFVFLRVINAQS